MTYPTPHTPEELDDMIVQEKLQVALEFQHDAWAESTADGIEPEIIADAAMITAIRETVRVLGEDQAEALLESLRERILAGEFSPERVLQ
ncbi:hypothetical protein [Hoeflea olei]|uniref:Uncharacterized protein n=1 Tax=Hoeflea olei TaxID=1480615 RepID=A0A1C1YW33_9HYPH|nr:hypothetical protein [Hoeflea olei]OCW57718.1 hypothetical protein AWJ14_02625 [Hoeflea olei]